MLGIVVDDIPYKNKTLFYQIIQFLYSTQHRTTLNWIENIEIFIKYKIMSVCNLYNSPTLEDVKLACAKSSPFSIKRTYWCVYTLQSICTRMRSYNYNLRSFKARKGFGRPEVCIQIVFKLLKLHDIAEWIFWRFLYISIYLYIYIYIYITRALDVRSYN